MSDVKALKSYLVGLGFDVNMAQFIKYEASLKTAERLVKGTTAGMATDLLKWQVGIVGLFTSISAAVVGTIDKVAMADQEYRLFGQRMFLNTNQARSLKVALDALGQPLEAIAFDPELHARYEQLRKDQLALAGQLGPDFEQTMKQVRDVRFEFTRLNVELKYLTMLAAKDIFKALGGGDFLEKLRGWNDYIIQHIPEWSRIIATYVVPVLKDAWMIGTDLFHIFMDLVEVFDDFVGILSGDSTVTGTANFEKFAKSLEKVTHFLALVFHYLSKIAGILTGAVGGGAAGGTIGGIVGTIAGIPGGPAGMLAGGLAGAGTGTAIGSGVGAAGGAVFDIWRALKGSGNEGSADASAGQGSIAAQARQLAGQVSGRIGVPADVIFAQWAHETGGFTNRGATSLNNLAGIRMPGSTQYRNFSSLNEFANYYSGLIGRRYPGAVGAQDVDSFATGLKRGGYFEDSLKNYEHGMQYRLGQERSGGGGSTNITVGDINIMQPNASAEHIKNVVIDAVATKAAEQRTRSLTQMKTVYG